MMYMRSPLAVKTPGWKADVARAQAVAERAVAEIVPEAGADHTDVPNEQ